MVVLLVLAAGVGQLAMVWPEAFKGDIDMPMKVAVATAAFAEGGLMATLASFCHEEYGTENFGVLYGTMLTFGAAGLFAFDQILFDQILVWYGKQAASGQVSLATYGDWNVSLFGSLAVAYFICFILAIVSHISV